MSLSDKFDKHTNTSEDPPVMKADTDAAEARHGRNHRQSAPSRKARNRFAIAYSVDGGCPAFAPAPLFEPLPFLDACEVNENCTPSDLAAFPSSFICAEPELCIRTNCLRIRCNDAGVTGLSPGGVNDNETGPVKLE